MGSNENSVLRVGLAVGHGTGPELADIFERFIHQMASTCFARIKLNRSPRIYHTYLSLLSVGESEADIHKETMEDVMHYERFCEEEAERGTRVIFRTAITAESLYLVRQHLEAIKVERFDNAQASVLLVRDQAQGFYTGSNDIGEGTVSRTCHFRRDVFGRIVSYALERASQVWGKGEIDSILMVYKYHLFGGIFDAWAKELSKEYAVEVKFIQPDTMNRNLLASEVQGRRLMIAGNEYADIMQVILLDMFGQGVQETSYAENVYLHPQLHCLSEYQTVHGSADDLVGKGIVNPTATIKAAAAILERHAGCKGIEDATNRTLQTLLRQNATTPDQGGHLTTAAFVDAVLANLTVTPSTTNGQLQVEADSQPANVTKTDPTNNTETAPPSSTDHSAPSTLPPQPTPTTTTTTTPPPDLNRITMGLKTALLIIDFQHDFLTATCPTPATATSLTTRIAHLTSTLRQHNLDPIFLRFHADPTHANPAWHHRDTTQSLRPFCLPGSRGADFASPVGPAPGDALFDKRAVFDPFLADGFEEYLRSRGVAHLILVGLCADVCVDAAARTAFQKGCFVTVVEDCVVGLWREAGECVEFMRRVYGVRAVGSGELLGMGV